MLLKNTPGSHTMIFFILHSIPPSFLIEMLKSVCDLNAELPLVYSQRKCILATCNLNQWALDFNGNLLRTIASIKEAKNSGATYRLGPELELSGYGCEDHFLENDTFLHCEQSLAIILNSDLTDGILCDIGCPMLHEGTRYNCRVFCLNRRIVLIRPKQLLANDGNYREHRFFTTWKHRHCIQDHVLSPILANATGTTTVPIGDAIIRLSDTSLASEICEELWGPDAAHIEYYLSGVEIVTNGSGSHHSLYKLNTRYDLIKGAAGKNGGVYMYSNSKGCDAGRLYYDGSALICCNGSLLAQASQFSVLDVEVVTACVDLNDVRIHRSCNHSYQTQASLRHVNRIPAIDCSHFSLCTGTAGVPTATEIEFKISAPEEECMLGPACWLWDYLRRSKAGGFLLPLSGGADSAAVATVVYTMCKYVVKGYKNSIGVNREILENDIRHLMGLSTATVYELELQIDANVLCNSILHTVYMGTSNSSTLTESRAQRLAADVNSYHKSFPIDSIVSAILSVFSVLFPGHIPRYASEGGTMAEDLALQNIQARSRMVVAYMCSQLFPWVRYTPNPTEDPSTASGVPASQFRSKGGGFLLVLGSSNVDEALRGYMTKVMALQSNQRKSKVYILLFSVCSTTAVVQISIPLVA